MVLLIVLRTNTQSLFPSSLGSWLLYSILAGVFNPGIMVVVVEVIAIRTGRDPRQPFPVEFFQVFFGGNFYVAKTVWSTL